MRGKAVYFGIILFAIAGMFVVVLTPQIASAQKELNSDVSVWDSSVPIDVSAGIFPIGGSGQIAGNFAVDTFTKKDTAIQVALRAQERFVGPIEPIGNVYFVPVGESPPGFPLWNFDWSLDFGTEFLETQLGKDLTSLNMEDFTVILEIEDLEGNIFTLDFGDFSNLIGPIVLSQSSQNIGFGFITIPIDSKAYDIILTVSDKGKIAESKITVIVTDETPVDGKVDICHKGKNTINVSVNAVQAHLKHGDTVGPC